ncbi:MAG: ABC transporter ATP-binding protein [Nitratireductor sp.]|uniref:ABC transporter ATP-binding protein n=1 Tax=Nitratireductor sp. TaxID=1872084 RepID=UPI002601CA29|nr:ABC transporter ATP-binding protein [Nitratireductor sp.]MCV0349234.1 ABC transporter ATP-binding protein [Nitratireductor sp.]
MKLLDISGLSVSFNTLRGPVEVLKDVSFDVMPGEVVGVVGESGSGKSVTSLAIMGLLGHSGKITSGNIALSGTELTTLSGEELRALRGPEMAMIFQEPGTSLNPVQRVGDQIVEAMTEHAFCPPAEARRRAVELMDRVGIPAPDLRARDYPHQLSGGMKQRIMIAIALACRPKLLIADEPTTALDVTIQAQILNLILDLKDEFGMGVMLITHDMGVVAQIADRVVVMYGGQVVERSEGDALFTRSAHPYSRLLLRSIPSASQRQDDLPIIKGTMPAAGRFPDGCRFHERCPMAMAACALSVPPLNEAGPAHFARCFRTEAIDELEALA